MDHKLNIMNTHSGYLSIIAIAMFVFAGCATTSLFTPGSGNKYQYIYSMTYPEKSKQLLFQDDSIIVQFKIDEAAIRFQLQNISSTPLHIVWNNVSLHRNGRYYSIRHSDNLYTDRIDTNNSILLPSLGYIRDLVIPRTNISFNGKMWVEEDLFPTTDNRNPELESKIKKSIGQQVGLVLPVAYGSVVKNYEFDFQIDSVKQIPWKDYYPVKRIPEPPAPQSQPLLNNVTTAVIVVGVVGITTYLLTSKKNPPIE